MKTILKIEQLKALRGVELNIEVLIMVILWIYEYYVAFWICLIICTMGTIIVFTRNDRIEKLAEMRGKK